MAECRLYSMGHDELVGVLLEVLADRAALRIQNRWLRIETVQLAARAGDAERERDEARDRLRRRPCY